MTKEITTSGMIIKETKVGEGNKIFTILTAGHGKLQASGAGVRSFKSKLGAGCNLFCYSDFIFKKGKSKDIYNIVSADKKMDFFDLRYDIKKLALVNYLCELANCTTVPENDCSDILKLLLNSVYYIQKNEFDLKVKPVFELRLMCETGFLPNLSLCQKCGSTENLCFFSIEDGVAECSKCHKTPNISPSALEAMKYISSSDSKNIFNFRINEETLQQLTAITEQYTIYHLGLVPKSLIYLKSL